MIAARGRAATARVAVAVLLVLGVGGCSATIPVERLDAIGHVILELPDESGVLTTGPCAFLDGCARSLTSDQVTVFWFADEDDAAAAATRLGTDGRRVDHYVVRYDDTTLSDDVRRAYEDAVRTAG